MPSGNRGCDSRRSLPAPRLRHRPRVASPPTHAAFAVSHSGVVQSKPAKARAAGSGTSASRRCRHSFVQAQSLQAFDQLVQRQFAGASMSNRGPCAAIEHVQRGFHPGSRVHRGSSDCRPSVATRPGSGRRACAQDQAGARQDPCIGIAARTQQATGQSSISAVLSNRRGARRIR